MLDFSLIGLVGKDWKLKGKYTRQQWCVDLLTVLYQPIGNLFLLTVPLPRTNFVKNSFSYQGAVLWNSLPPDLWQTQTLNGVRIGCRCHFPWSKPFSLLFFLL